MATLVTDCIRCGSKRTTFDVLSSNPLGFKDGAQWQLDFEVFSCCRACSTAIILILRLANVGLRPLFEDTKAKWLESSLPLNDVCEIIGTVNLSHNSTLTPPDYLPPDIDAPFREGATCSAMDCFNAAGAMFRLCLDRATRSFLPDPGDEVDQPNSKQRRDLGLRLPWLFDHGLLPEGLRALAQCVREDGNDAAHAGNLTKADVDDLIDFTAVLLERLYTEPERLRLAEERRARRRAPALPH